MCYTAVSSSPLISLVEQCSKSAGLLCLSVPTNNSTSWFETVTTQELEPLSAEDTEWTPILLEAPF